MATGVEDKGSVSGKMRGRKKRDASHEGGEENKSMCYHYHDHSNPSYYNDNISMLSC